MNLAISRPRTREHEIRSGANDNGGNIGFDLYFLVDGRRFLFQLHTKVVRQRDCPALPWLAACRGTHLSCSHAAEIILRPRAAICGGVPDDHRSLSALVHYWQRQPRTHIPNDNNCDDMGDAIAGTFCLAVLCGIVLHCPRWIIP